MSTERITFHFDPRCPWCFQTSRWITRLEELGEVDVEWDLFSLAIQNHDGDMADFDDATAGGIPALRTCMLVRDLDGNAALGRLYAALGAARHHRVEDIDDHATIEASLTEAGLPEARLTDALDDRSTFDRLVEHHCALVERTSAFGVPAIVLDGGDGPAIFGPVISNPPASDDEARALWEHTVWLVRYENFSELKRDRLVDPDLETFRRRRAQRQAEKASSTT